MGDLEPLRLLLSFGLLPRLFRRLYALSDAPEVQQRETDRGHYCVDRIGERPLVVDREVRESRSIHLTNRIGCRVRLFQRGLQQRTVEFTSPNIRETYIRFVLAAHSENTKFFVDDIKLEVQRNLLDMATARQKITVLKDALQQAEENLRINRDRYQEQVGTATDVIDAQTLLTQIKNDNYQAIFDYEVALSRVKRARGEL